MANTTRRTSSARRLVNVDSVGGRAQASAATSPCQTEASPGHVAFPALFALHWSPYSWIKSIQPETALPILPNFSECANGFPVIFTLMQSINSRQFSYAWFTVALAKVILAMAEKELIQNVVWFTRSASPQFYFGIKGFSKLLHIEETPTE